MSSVENFKKSVIIVYLKIRSQVINRNSCKSSEWQSISAWPYDRISVGRISYRCPSEKKDTRMAENQEFMNTYTAGMTVTNIKQTWNNLPVLINH